MLNNVNFKLLGCKLALIFGLIPVVVFAGTDPKRSTSLLASIDDRVAPYGPYIVKAAFRNLHYELQSQIVHFEGILQSRALTEAEKTDLAMYRDLSSLRKSSTLKEWNARFHFKRGSDPVFKLSPGEPPRTAVTGVKASDPIYFNLDRISSLDDFRYSQAVSLLIHELAHKIKKPSQFDLDRVATKIENDVAAREKVVSLGDIPARRDLIFVTTEPESEAEFNLAAGNFVPSIVAVVEGAKIKPFIKYFTKPPVKWGHGYFETSQKLSSGIADKDLNVRLRYSYTRHPENPFIYTGDETGVGYERELNFKFTGLNSLKTLTISSAERDSRTLRMSPTDVEMAFVMDDANDPQCKALVKGAIKVDMRETPYRFSYTMGSFAYDKRLSLVLLSENTITEEQIDGKWLEENDALQANHPLRGPDQSTMLVNSLLNKYLGRKVQLIGFNIHIRRMDDGFWRENIDGVYYLPLAKPIDLGLDGTENPATIKACAQKYPPHDIFRVCVDAFGPNGNALQCLIQTSDVDVVKSCLKAFGNNQNGVTCTSTSNLLLIDACTLKFGNNADGATCSKQAKDSEAIELCFKHFSTKEDRLQCSTAKTAQIVRACVQPGQGIKKPEDKEMRPYPPLECITDYSRY